MSVPPAAALQQRYLETGEIEHLQAAITHSRADLAACGPDDPSRPVCLSRLSNAMRMRYEHLGDERDLHDAIAAGRECVDRTPPGHRSKPLRLSNLGFALRLRYERLGHPGDLEQAVDVGEKAVAGADDDDPGLPRMISNVAVARRVRYEVSGESDDLARAIDAGTRCLRHTAPDAYERRGMLSNLGLAYLERFEIARDRSDLAQAAALLHQGLDVTPEDDPDWPAYALNLSVAMRTVAVELTAAAIDEAVELAERAQARLPSGHRERAGAWSDLGRAHRIRARMTGDKAEAERAIAYRRKAAADPVAAPTTRALAAAAWADWSREDGDLTAAVAGFSAAVELLSLVAWHGLGAAAQERHLRRWRDLTRTAAATCAEAGTAPRGVELLEQGRAVMWNQLLDRRADFDTLRAREPDLAHRLDQIRVALDDGHRSELRSGTRLIGVL
ncbi:MAG: hypothetical protein ABW000_23950 [Actinoplanes sp.]